MPDPENEQTPSLILVATFEASGTVGQGTAPPTEGEPA
jgi:hypothetical protein